MMMWKVPDKNLLVELPPGFYLMEDEDFVHLFYGEEKIVNLYYRIANPEILKAIVRAYKEKKGI
jgi:hypothetical protein